MQTIIISDGTQTVEMPRVKAVQVGGAEVAATKKMASGRIVKDVFGFRPTVSCSWDYVPADTIRTLLAMLRNGGFFSVQYPAPEGDASGEFSINYPTLGIFAFRDGVPIWHSVSLTMESREVL